jgi:hypothetical protein
VVEVEESISRTLSAAQPPLVKLTAKKKTASAWAVLSERNRSLCRPLTDRAERDFEIDGGFPGFHPAVFRLLWEAGSDLIDQGIGQPVDGSLIEN